MEEIVYRSGVSKGLIVLLAVVIAVPFIATIVFKAWVGAIAFGCVAAFIAHMFSTTYYTISGNTLKIRGGFLINIVMDIAAITKIDSTNTILSGPALSFDRLEIFYNKYDSVVVSPGDKAGFIAKLKEINPEIVVK